MQSEGCISQRKGGISCRRHSEKNSVIFMFVFPAFLIYTAFVMVSIVWAGYYSFFDWSGVGEKIFVGFKKLYRAFDSGSGFQSNRRAHADLHDN